MDAMTGWLSDDEPAAWRGLLQMTAHLNARLNRELQEGHGLSLADYEVLVRLSDTAEARLRVYELAQELQWEQSRLSHHLARMQRRGLVARCLLYTSDAADEEDSVDLGGRRIIKKKKQK